MDRILTVKEAAQILYGDARKSHCNVIARQCVNGTITHCEKHGAKWYINATREWPRLFGEVDPEPARKITQDTTMGELMGMIAGAAAS